MKIQLKKLKRSKKKQHLDTNLLNGNSYAVRFNNEIRRTFDPLPIEELEKQFDNEEHIADIWRTVKESITTTSKEILPL